MYHSFFIQLSVDGHLRFHILGIVSSAAMNIEGHVSFSILDSSRYTPSNRTGVIWWFYS